MLRLDRLPALAMELAGRRPDVFVAGGGEVYLTRPGVPRAPSPLSCSSSISIRRGQPYDYDGALRVAAGDKADAVLILSSGAFFVGRFILMGAIRKHRLPF